ncbi:hypothetical protein AD954_14610 [Acetobacter cerevisiae]|uniref:Integrase catalytic domain-containing protein n=1 Tax=Acetobacter cerevisiae TaxID=178900 RepID=A0A149V5U9_9PROT|nr:hypothetical protein AD954_14610 [Acetobacter cerevisiae]
MARELTSLVKGYDKPLMIVSDNGTEFTSHAILKWADWREDYIRCAHIPSRMTEHRIRSPAKGFESMLPKPLASHQTQTIKNVNSSFE